MKLRRLGNSGLLVSELALGTMIFGEESERGVAPAEARRIIARYLEAGGNHFDVADVYAGGRAEEIVGEATAAERDRIVLTTKVRWPTGPSGNDVGLSRVSYRAKRGSESPPSPHRPDRRPLHARLGRVDPARRVAPCLRRSRRRRQGPLHRRLQPQGMAGDEGVGPERSARLGTLRRRPVSVQPRRPRHRKRVSRSLCRGRRRHRSLGTARRRVPERQVRSGSPPDDGGRGPARRHPGCMGRVLAAARHRAELGGSSRRSARSRSPIRAPA